MYNKKVLSKAVKELHTPRAPKRKNGNTNIVSNTKPIVSDQGYKQGPPPEGTHYRIPGDTLYNPTPYSITAVSDNGIVKELKPYDETPVLFPGATEIDEYHHAEEGMELELTDEEIQAYRDGGYIVEELPKAQVGSSGKYLEYIPKLPKFYPNQFMTTSNLGKFTGSLGDINLNQLKGALFKEAMGETHKWPILEKQLITEFGEIPTSLPFSEIQRVTNDAIVPYLMSLNPKGNSLHGVYHRDNDGLSLGFTKGAIDYLDAGKYPREYNDFTSAYGTLSTINNYKNDFASGVKFGRSLEDIINESLHEFNFSKTRRGQSGNPITSVEDLEMLIDKYKNPEIHEPLSPQTSVLSGLGEGVAVIHYNPKGTLAAAHSYIDPDAPNTRTYTQLQSDALQGPYHIWKKPQKQIEKMQKDLKRLNKDLNFFNSLTEEEKLLWMDGKTYKDMQSLYGVDDYEQAINKHHTEIAKAEERVIAAKGSNPKQKELLEKNWESVLLQQLMTEAAAEGMTKIRVPTGETSIKIQNYKQTPQQTENDWRDVQNIFGDGPRTSNPPILDYTNSQKTIINRYEKMPKTLKKSFGLNDSQIRQVTDRHDNTWWEIDIPESFLQGQGQIIHKSGGSVNIKFQKGGDNVVQCSPDKPCAETDQVQEILDDIHRKKSEALKIDFNIVDNIIKSNSTAEKEFNKYGIKSADQLLNCGNLSNCSTLATGSYKSLDPSIDPVKTLSNYRFKKAVNAKELPFETVGQYSSIKNIPPEELEAGDLISMMGKTDGYDYNHMIKYAGNNSYVQSSGPAEVWEKADWHPEWYPNVPTTVYRYSPRKEEIESLEEIARTNPTYYGVGPLATNPATPISHKEGGLVKAQLGQYLGKAADLFKNTYKINPFAIKNLYEAMGNYNKYSTPLLGNVEPHWLKGYPYLTGKLPALEWNDLQENAHIFKGNKYPSGPLTDIEMQKLYDVLANTRERNLLKSLSNYPVETGFFKSSLLPKDQVGNIQFSDMLNPDTYAYSGNLRDLVNSRLYGAYDKSKYSKFAMYLAMGLSGTAAAYLAGHTLDDPKKNAINRKIGYPIYTTWALRDPNITTKDTLINLNDNELTYGQVNDRPEGRILIGGDFIDREENTVRPAKSWLEDKYGSFGDDDQSIKSVKSYYGIEDGKLKLGAPKSFRPETKIIPNRFDDGRKVSKAKIHNDGLRLVDEKGKPLYQNAQQQGKLILHSQDTGNSIFISHSGKNIQQTANQINNFIKDNKNVKPIVIDNGRFIQWMHNEKGLTNTNYDNFYSNDYHRGPNAGYNIVIKQDGGVLGLSKYAKPVASLLSTYIKPFQIASELPLFSNYSNVLKNTNLEGWADRFEMANLLSDMNYAGPEFDFLAQMNASKTEDAMNALMQKAIKHDLTGWRQVNPKTIPYKNRFNETVNIDAQRQAMRDAGVDFSNYPSRSQYMATHVPKNIYGDREGGMDRLGSMGMDALYLAGLPQLEMKYAPHQWRVTQPFDFSTGNWNDWFTRHTVNKQPIITEGQFNPKLNPSEVFFDSGYSKGDVLSRQYGMGQGINTRRWASGKGAKIAEPDLDNPFPAFYDFYAISPTERELLRQEQEAVQKGWSTGWADQYRKGGAAEVGDLPKAQSGLYKLTQSLLKPFSRTTINLKTLQLPKLPQLELELPEIILPKYGMTDLEKVVNKAAPHYVNRATDPRNFERAAALDAEYGTNYVQGLKELQRHLDETNNIGELPLNIKIEKDPDDGSGGYSAWTNEGKMKNLVGYPTSIRDRKIVLYDNTDPSDVRRILPHEGKHHYTMAIPDFYSNAWGDFMSSTLEPLTEINKTNPTFADKLIKPAFKGADYSKYEYFEKPQEIDAYINTNLRDQLVDEGILEHHWDTLDDSKVAEFLMTNPEKHSKAYLDLLKSKDFINMFNKGVYAIPAAIGVGAMSQDYKAGGQYKLGDTVDEDQIRELEKLGYTFEEV